MEEIELNAMLEVISNTTGEEKGIIILKIGKEDEKLFADVMTIYLETRNQLESYHNQQENVERC